MVMVSDSDSSSDDGMIGNEWAGVDVKMSEREGKCESGNCRKDQNYFLLSWKYRRDDDVKRMNMK